MNVIAYFPFAIAIFLALFALYVTFFTDVESDKKKNRANR